MMLVLTALLGLGSLLYARAGWSRQGTHYYSLFQFLMMGLNGAFLTGDLFNLFVFFEVLLAASYGLLLHGSGQLRVRSGLHYIAMNLTASLLFLIGISLIYGVTGTLNMAQLSSLVGQVSPQDRPLLHAGFALLGVVFLVKAGIWPLSFWLPSTYMAASPPVGAMFAIMTKVGLYATIRLSFLMVGSTSGPSMGFGATILIALGFATVLFGVLGALAAQSLGRLAAHSVLISSGTTLAVVGLALLGASPDLLAGAFYYMIGSTLACGVLFLLVEPVSREDGGIAALLALTADAYGVDFRQEDIEPTMESPGLTVGVPLLAATFGITVLALSGMPPLPGFIGKLAMIQGLMNTHYPPDVFGWAFIALLLISGLATLIGLARIGIQNFWSEEVQPQPAKALEIAPVLLLLMVLLMISFKADVVLRYTKATSQLLYENNAYAVGVLTTPPVSETDEAQDQAERE